MSQLLMPHMTAQDFVVFAVSIMLFCIYTGKMIHEHECCFFHSFYALLTHVEPDVQTSLRETANQEKVDLKVIKEGS